MTKDQDGDDVELLEPLKAREAKEVITAILSGGFVVPPKGHALREMEKDNLSMVDVTNILRAGVVSEAEWENGCWRHHIETPRMCVIVGFRSRTELYIATAWRKHR